MRACLLVLLASASPALAQVPGYQSRVGLAATQLAGEVQNLRAELGRSPASVPVKLQLARLAEGALGQAERFRRLTASTADRNTLYAAHASLDASVENLLSVIDRVGPPTPGLAEALARTRYADAELHAALTGGDTSPDVVRLRAVRVAGTTRDQLERLREMTGQLVQPNAFDRSLRNASIRADRLRRNLEAGGTMNQAGQDFANLSSAWATASQQVAKEVGPNALVRQQVVRIDTGLRDLGSLFEGAPGLPPTNPDNGFLPRGALFVVAAGQDGGPRVRVYSDLRGAAVADFYAYDPNFRGGVRVAVADLTGDGIPDIVTSPGPGAVGLVRVFDGRTLRLLTEFVPYDANWTGGVFVAAATRLPNGVAYVATGADVGAGPHVKVFDATTNKELHSFFAYDPNFRGGVRVALGDVNGDGIPDIITAPGPGHEPRVRVFNGRNRAALADFNAFDRDWQDGLFVAAADVSRDGRADVIVGTDAGRPAVVRVFDGTGRNLGQVEPFIGFHRGGVRVAAQDIDGDGVPDIVCSPGPGLPPVLRAFSGANRRPLGEFATFEPGFRGGAFVGGR